MAVGSRATGFPTATTTLQLAYNCCADTVLSPWCWKNGAKVLVVVMCGGTPKRSTPHQHETQVMNTLDAGRFRRTSCRNGETRLNARQLRLTKSCDVCSTSRHEGSMVAMLQGEHWVCALRFVDSLSLFAITLD